MSYLISGLNIKNIFEYDSSSSYSKYDIVDYQLNTGISVYPSYTGFLVTGLSSWFNNDKLENFYLDANYYVTGWKNLVPFSGSLAGSGGFVDFNKNYFILKQNEFLSGTGFASPNKTIFIATELNSEVLKNAQEIFRFGSTENNGVLKVSGSNSLNSAKVIIDSNQFNAVSPIYNELNIFTITQNSSSSTLTIRHNGINMGSINPYNSEWNSDIFRIGSNVNTNKESYLGIKYYEIVNFTGVLTNTELTYYEKYLFEKYSNKAGLYFAKLDVPSSESYSPITFTGNRYWTRSIDDLFYLTYPCSASFSAKLTPLQFGDGYKTNIVNGINSLNASFELSYDGLTDKQAKSLITYFENTPEAENKSIYEGFKGVNIDLFFPYKSNSELYFLDIKHDSIYKDINKISITAESLYESPLDYKGMFINLDEINCRTYDEKNIYSLAYNDVFYYPSEIYVNRGFYFYTGQNINAVYTGPMGSTGPTGPMVLSPIYIAPQNSPTGNSSFFTKNFYFKGDLDFNINSKIRTFSNDFKNSTKEYEKDGINYNLLEFDVKFTKRNNKEAYAILKFLDDKAGFKIFDYTLPQPYNKTISVYCPEWNHSFDFKNNHTINAKFVEFKNPLKTSSSFNTIITYTS